MDSINLKDVKVKGPRTFFIPGAINEFINEELFLLPLYNKISVDSALNSYVFFPHDNLKLELYCHKCKTKRIFCFENSKHANYSFCTPTINPGANYKPRNIGNMFRDEIDYFSFIAKSDCGHELVVDFKVLDQSNIMKIGQFPSVLDFDENLTNQKFLKMLDDDYRDYYKTACKLSSYGTYIGSMVYLRRIFEKLLQNIATENFENDEYQKFIKLRMDEKVNQLIDYLPAIILEQGFKEVYTLVSDGIHNLTEEECGERFYILKSAIEEILIDKMTLDEKQKRIKNISNQLMNAKSKLSAK